MENGIQSVNTHSDAITASTILIDMIGKVVSRSLTFPIYKTILSRPIIIVVGMHRSGTSMLVKLLENGGSLMGQRQSRNAESLFFQQINRDVLDLFGCSWRCLDFLPSTAALQSGFGSLKKSVRRRMEDGLVFGHFGRSVFRCLRDTHLSWGWKDPRSSLLLPIWKSVFPQATVIHIVRDGRNVAKSLSRREKTAWGNEVFDTHEKKRRYFSDLQLWESYITRIQEGMALFARSYTIQYEKLVSSPHEEIEKLVQHTGLPIKRFKLDPTALVDPQRTNRYNKNEFAWSNGMSNHQSEMLKELGYK